MFWVRSGLDFISRRVAVRARAASTSAVPAPSARCAARPRRQPAQRIRPVRCAGTLPLIVAAVLVLLACSGAVSQRALASKTPAELQLYPHGGPVMTSMTVHLIFWLPSRLQDGTAPPWGGVSRSSYVNTIEQYFRDIGGSGLFGVATKYYQTVNGSHQYISNSVSYGGAVLNTSDYPGAISCSITLPRSKNCVNDNTVENLIAAAISSQPGWTDGANQLYFVYTDPGEQICLPFGCFPLGVGPKGACAYHDFYTDTNLQSVIYAAIPYLGNTSACIGGPISSSSPNGPAIDAEISTSSHEQFEAATDPLFNAWYADDGPLYGFINGDEIGDDCAYDFGVTPYHNQTANENLNGHFYIVQREWDNAAPLKNDPENQYQAGQTRCVSSIYPFGPQHVAATSSPGGQATVTWAVGTPAADDGSALTKVVISARNSANSVVSSQTVSPGTTSATFDTLPGGTYTFAVRIFNTAGGSPLGVTSPIAVSRPPSDLSSGATLYPGEGLVSPNAQYRLIMQRDGNLVLYHGSTALWATYTFSADSWVTMQHDGNLVVYDPIGSARWNSRTAGCFGGTHLLLQDDGNLVIYLGSEAVWDRGSGVLSPCVAPGSPSVAVWPNPNTHTTPGQQDVFWKGSGNTGLWEAVWNNGWKGPSNISGIGTVASSPSAAVNDQRREEDIDWRGTDGQLWSTHWNSGWGTPHAVPQMGQLGSAPGLAVWPAGTALAGQQDVFWKGSGNNGLWEGVWNNGWSGPRLVPNVSTVGSNPSAVVNAPLGEEETFWRGTDGRLWTDHWSRSGWGAPHSIPEMGYLGSGPSATVWPTATRNPAGQQDVFWKAAGGKGLWEAVWSVAKNAWVGPSRVPNVNNVASAPTAVVNAARNEEDIFWKGTDNQLWEITWSGQWIGPHIVSGMGPLG